MTDRWKRALRRTYQTVRKTLPQSYQQEASHQICARIQTFETYHTAKHIALYRAIRGEIILDDIYQSALSQGKHCYFPVLNNNQTLAFLPTTNTSHFSNNRFGIAEPALDRALARSIDQLDLIFIPLVAFDRYGTRLGMGKGYYDKTLACPQKPLLIGVAYEFQRRSYIAPEPWDIPLDLVFTEYRTYISKSYNSPAKG